MVKCLVPEVKGKKSFPADKCPLSPLYLRGEEISPQGKSPRTRGEPTSYPCKCFATRKSLWRGSIDNSFLKRVDRFHRKRIIRRDGFPACKTITKLYLRPIDNSYTLPFVYTPFFSLTSIDSRYIIPSFYFFLYGGEEERKKRRRRNRVSSLPLDPNSLPPVLHTKIPASCFPRFRNSWNVPQASLKHRETSLKKDFFG